MAKLDEVELFLKRLDLIDKKHGILISYDFDEKNRQSIAYNFESDTFDIFFSTKLTVRKVKTFIKAVQFLCKKTLAERREKVSSTTLRADRTFFHKAIRKHYVDKFLAVYCRDKYNKSAYSHIAVKLLDITVKEKQAYFDSEKNRLVQMTVGKGGATGDSGRKFFVIDDPDMVVKIGHALLNSRSPNARKRFLNMVLGLMCLTGRRATEVLLMTVGIASLTPIKPNIMLFHGQLKNEHALKPVDDYHIYTLANSKLIASKIVELQEMVKNPQVDSLPILGKIDFSNYDDDDFIKLETNDRLNRALGRRQKMGESGNTLTALAQNARFGNYISVSMNGSLTQIVPTNPKDFKAKQLRAMYVLLAHKYFVHDAGVNKQLTNFGFQLLGHTKAGAIDHYTNYRVKNVPIG